ncbi:unnamed protein product [Parajaminaea phylloscopi]
MAKSEDPKAGGGVGPSRRTWDMQEYAQKAKERDREEKERAQENEERLRKGKGPLKRRREELPKPTETLQARKGPLDLEKNVGKTLMVDGSGEDGRKGPGYYCELCKRTCKDSIGYLDHINGRSHLRRLGQTTQVARATVEQVRDRLAVLLERHRSNQRAGGGAKTLEYDFQARVKQIAEKEEQAREERKRKKLEDKARREREAKARANAGHAGTVGGSGESGDDEMMRMMGFGGFGSSKK